MKRKIEDEKSKIATLFILVPTIFLILGFLFFPYPRTEFAFRFIQIPLIFSLSLLSIGFIFKKWEKKHIANILGWSLFGLFWSTQPRVLYLYEGGDIFNAGLCVIGVYALFYLAYHEWLSHFRKEDLNCLRWASGAAAVSGIIYFGVEMTSLAPWLIRTVAIQSTALLNLFTGIAEIEDVNIFYAGEYAVTIIFACTAIQSMVIFIGMISPLSKVDIKRKVIAILITVVPIYFLNLIRNASIAFLMGERITDFSTAHNIIGKGGSLIALIVLLFIVTKIIPELFDEILELTDLPKRNGPLEKYFSKYIWSKKQ